MDQSEKTYYAMVGDIGGTNARMQLISLTKKSNKPNIIKEKFHDPHQFADLTAVCVEFLKEFVNTDNYPSFAVISIAGPVKDNKCETANIQKWPVSNGDASGKTLGISKFILVNDFVAIGYSLLRMPPDDIVTIRPGKPIEGDIKGVIGPGSGLGECFLYAAPSATGDFTYYVKGGEGGHANMSPRNQVEWDWLNYLLKHYPYVGDVISTERSFVGTSIPYMYAFFSERDGKKLDNIKDLDSKLILQNGLEKKDPIAVHTLNLLLSLFGSEVGNFGIRYLSYGGIYLVGNITLAVLDYLQKTPDAENEFIKGVFSKEPILNTVLKDIPIYAVKQPELGLLGAFVEAQRMID